MESQKDDDDILPCIVYDLLPTKGGQDEAEIEDLGKLQLEAAVKEPTGQSLPPSSETVISFPRNPSISYRPTMPPPPTSPLDNNGLREIIAYGKRMRNYRDISPRISAFIQKIKD